MQNIVKAFFKEEGIEYFSALAYSDCRETAPEIMRRESFEPKSVFIFLIPYYGGETVNLSRYAASRDYHIYIKDVTSRLIARLARAFPESSFKGYGDHSPIDERSAALAAGLGILGDNGLLINEKYGSYVFIADVVSDVPPELAGAVAPKPLRRCLGCGACKRSCPTGILGGSGGDCLSAITQRKGELAEEEKALMRRYNTVWGCDECQAHCPYNKDPLETPIAFFREERIEELTSEKLAAMSEEDFRSRAFAWRKRKTVERNLEILGV